jgi:RHS repeat-associated protein
VTNPTADTTLEFDGCGNRTKLNGVALATPTNLNQPKDTGIASDINGNLQTWNGWSYTYDVQNRLTKATDNGANTAYFYYDGKNRQIARSINGVVRFNVWDDWELIEEYGTGNVVAAKYLQGAHGPIKSLIGTIFYYYQDELGSTSHIADATGHLLEYYKYDLYGKPSIYNSGGTLISFSASLGTRDLFSGERFVPELGLYDLRNRFMLPDLGRFLQPDPIGFKSDASNLYRYCGNDWASKTDPMGLDVTPDQPGFTIKMRDSLADAVGIDLLRQIRALVSPAPQAVHAEHGSAEQVSATGQNGGVTGAGTRQYNDAAWAPANDQYQPMYLTSERVKNTNDWTLRPTNKDKKPLEGEVASYEMRKVDYAKGISKDQVNFPGSGWRHRDDNTIRDHVQGEALKGKPTGEVGVKQSYIIYFKPKGHGDGFKYRPKTDFLQRYRWTNGVSTGNDLIPQ